MNIVPGKEKGSITNDSFAKLVKETPDAVLFVDVRDAKEFDRGHLKGAVNIPIGELDKKLASLPTSPGRYQLRLRNCGRTYRIRPRASA